MKVKCLKSCKGGGVSLVNGQEYDLTPEQIKVVGSSVMVIEAAKPARKPKPAADKTPRKAKAAKAK